MTWKNNVLRLKMKEILKILLVSAGFFFHVHELYCRFGGELWGKVGRKGAKVVT